MGRTVLRVLAEQPASFCCLKRHQKDLKNRLGHISSLLQPPSDSLLSLKKTPDPSP
jgi:hypothetical protein